uniref:C-type lectin domain-containing protein n=1 Tax=Sparus aurata TaxID=8175 RepID=A0A671Z2F1_SPAAU
ETRPLILCEVEIYGKKRGTRNMIFSHILVLCFVPLNFTYPGRVCAIITLFNASILSFNLHHTFIYFVASPFQLIMENKTWEHALEYCRERNMDLATILSEDDQTLAELEARKADTPFLWLGLHYTCILEVWFWVADHRLEFNRWAPGEKTGDCDRSAVIERAEGHKWFSKSDYDEFNFICQEF